MCSRQTSNWAIILALLWTLIRTHWHNTLLTLKSWSWSAGFNFSTFFCCIFCILIQWGFFIWKQKGLKLWSVKSVFSFNFVQWVTIKCAHKKMGCGHGLGAHTVKASFHLITAITTFTAKKHSAIVVITCKLLSRNWSDNDCQDRL